MVSKVLKSGKIELEEFSTNHICRGQILDLLFRRYSIVHGGSILDAPSEKQYEYISQTLDIPRWIVSDVIRKFLAYFSFFLEFHKNNKISWNPQIIKLRRKVQTYLFRIYRFAPIFDYSRARINLEKLYLKCENNRFWPRINAQVALVIYVTDYFDKNPKREHKIIQKNLRALCNVSSTPFHRARNELEMNYK